VIGLSIRAAAVEGTVRARRSGGRSASPLEVMLCATMTASQYMLETWSPSM
jgi:hypothetical protein